MAVSEDVPVVLRRFNGFSDPRMPIGFWAGQGIVTGTATGGSSFINFILAPAQANRLSLMFSLEQLTCKTSDVTATSAVLDVAGCDEMSTRFSVIRPEVAFVLEAVADPSFATIRADMLPGLRGIWLGEQIDPTIGMSMNVGTPNINLEVFSARAQGYVWNPRSVLADGGPGRPPTGLYIS